MRSVVTCSLLVTLLSIAVVRIQADCDISIISGNASIMAGHMIQSPFSEKEVVDYVLCSLDAVSTTKVTCQLTKNVLKMDQAPIGSSDMGIDFTLISSVDELADKPYSLRSITCPLTCTQSEASLSTEVSVFMAKIVFVNDHTPAISQSASVINNLPETFPYAHHELDLSVVYDLNITAMDGDTASDVTSQVAFSITEGNDDGTFSIETTAVNPGAEDEYFVAHLFLEQQLNYHAHPSYTLTIHAMDSGSPPLSSTMTLTIHVQHMNNSLGPAFDSNFYRATINESVLDGEKHEISMQPDAIHARDEDTGSDVGITYTMLVDDCGSSCQAIGAAFSIDTDTGVITFDSSAQYEDINNYVAVFGVKATGNDAYKRSSIAIVTIYLPPQRITTMTEASTTETTHGVPPTTTVVPVSTTDATSNPPTTCSPCTPCPTEAPSTAVPTDNPPTTNPASGDTTIQSSTATVTAVTCPVTGSSEPTAHTTTEVPTPTNVTEGPTPANTTDVPTSPATPCVCPTTTVCPTTAETEGTTTAKWTTSTSFDPNSTVPHSEIPSTNIPSVSTETTRESSTHWTDASTTKTPFVTTTIRPPPPPPNPYFLETLHLSMTTVVGTVVVQVEYDNAPTTIHYTLTDCNEDSSSTEYFGIDGGSGAVTVIKALYPGNYCLNVTATSQSSNLQDSGTVVIEVIDGSTEQIFEQDYYEVHIPEDVDTRTLLVDLNSTYETQHESDVNYMIRTNVEAGFFFINQSTGELFAIKRLDHEAHPLYQLIISVSLATGHQLSSDGDFQFGNLSANEALVQLFVDDINDNSPVFDVGSVYSIGITSYLGQGQIVTTLTATDADTSKEFNEIYYSLATTSAPFFVNSDSGLLRVTKSLEILQKSDQTNYEFNVTAANSKDGLTMPTNLQMTVYILSADEIITMNTPKSVVDFDNLSTQITSTFKEKLGVDARIIQWEISEDGSNAVYLYMFPLASTAVQGVEEGGGAPLKKDEMLKMIATNAASLQPFFATDSAKSYSDVMPDAGTGTSTAGLIAAIVVLAVLLSVAVTVGAVYGVLQHRKKTLAAYTQSNLVYSNGGHGETVASVTEPAEEDSKYSYVDAPKERTYESILSELYLEPNPESTEREPSSSSYAVNSNYLESFNENVDHLVASSPVDEVEVTDSELPHPEPELDYLKSILVNGNSKSDDEVQQRRKSVVKFADDITMDTDDGGSSEERL